MCAEHHAHEAKAQLEQAESRLNLLQWFLIAPIRFYQLFISPMTPPSCRYRPTCSQYTREAIALWGLKGVWLGMKRIFRCQPMYPGGYDPVPLPEEAA